MDLSARPSFNNKITSRGLICWLHGIAFVLHLVSGILGVLVTSGSDPKFPLTVPLVDFKNVSYGDPNFISPMPKTVAHVYAFVPSIFVEFFTAFAHLIYWLAILSDDFDEAIRKAFPSPSANPLRWIEYGVTASVMASFGNVNIGMTDLYYLFKTFALGIILQVCGYIIELLDSKSNDPRDQILFTVVYWVIGYIANFANVALILYQIFASNLHSELHLFIENTLPFAFYFSLFGIVCRYSYYKRGLWEDPWFAEKYYVLLSWSTKIAVYWLGFGTYRRILQDQGYAGSAVNWNVVRYMAIALPILPVIGFFTYDMLRYKKDKDYSKRGKLTSPPSIIDLAQRERRNTTTRFKRFT